MKIEIENDCVIIKTRLGSSGVPLSRFGMRECNLAYVWSWREHMDKICEALGVDEFGHSPAPHLEDEKSSADSLEEAAYILRGYVERGTLDAQAHLRRLLGL